MYCNDPCCNSGLTVVPNTVVAYNFDLNWIIAKSDPNFDSKEKKWEFWIFRKPQKGNTKNLYESIQANLMGPLDSTMFYKMLSEKGITLQLINWRKT
jgi:hypothetical protein